MKHKFQIPSVKFQISSVMAGAAVALAFALRIYRLGASDLTFDECASAFNSGKPLAEMMHYLVVEAFHELPPAYYLMLRAWRFLAGSSEFALRYFSLIWGVLGVALVYRLGRRGFSQAVGVLAAWFMTLQPFHFYYSQDARPYTLMMVQAMLLVYFFDRLCRAARWRWWIAFGLTGAWAMLTHYFMGYMVAALCVYLVLQVRAHRKVALVWFSGLAAVGLVMALWLLASRSGRLVRRVLLGVTWQGFFDRLAPAQGMLAEIVSGPVRRLPVEWLIGLGLLVAVGLVASLRQRWRTLSPGGAWLLPAWLLVPPALVILVPERLESRYNSAVLPAYCLLLALAVTWLWKCKLTRLLWPAVLGLVLYAHVWPLIPTMSWIKSDYGHVVAYLNRRARPGDSVVLNGDWQWVQQLYYPIQASLPRVALPPGTPPGLDPAQARPVLENLIGASKRIWVLPAAVTEADPKRFVAGWLYEHAYPVSGFRELMLYQVGTSKAEPVALNPPPQWGDVLQLESLRWVQNQAVPGEPLLLDLNWRVLRAPGRDVEIAIRLADRDGGEWYATQVTLGQFYAPSAGWQAGQRLTTHVGLPVSIGTPPGAYTARVSVVGLRASTGDDYVPLGGATILPCSDQNPCPPIWPEDMSPVQVTFGQGLTLAGYQVGGAEFTQGRFAAVTLYWRADQPQSLDVTERVALVDPAGREVSTAEGPPVAAWYPSSQWPAGQLVADPQVIFVPPKAAPGDYNFRVSLIGPDGRALQTTSGQDGWEVGPAVIRARERRFSAGPISHPLQVEFGDQVRLLGYDVQSRGGEVKLTLHWQALREMTENYTVFTHMLDAEGKLVGQKDSWPREGDSPTSFWMRREVVQDEYVISFEGGPGDYTIEMGLYDTETLARLPAVSNGARLLNDALVIPLSVER